MTEDVAFIDLGPIRHTLVLNRIESVEQLARCSARQLLGIDGVRGHHVRIIEEFLARRNLALALPVERRVMRNEAANLGRRADDAFGWRSRRAKQMQDS